MRLDVDLLQTGDAVVGVDLRGLQRGVSQQLLYFAHVRAVVQQMRRKGVPQYVGALFSLYALLVQRLFHDATHDAPRNARSFQC